MRNSNIRFTAVFLVCTLAPLTLNAKTKHPHPEPDQDRIVIESQIQLTGAPITGFIATLHYSRSYVYAERGPGNPVTLLDVTDPAHPVVVSEISMGVGASSLLSVAGTAAIAGQSTAPKQTVPPSVSIMDFSDPAQPRSPKHLTVLPPSKKCPMDRSSSLPTKKAFGY